MLGLSIIISSKDQFKSKFVKGRLATRVLGVAPMSFMMTHLESSIDCNLCALGKIERANQIVRMRNSIISLDKGNSSDGGYDCEAKLSREQTFLDNLRFASA